VCLCVCVAGREREWSKPEIDENISKMSKKKIFEYNR